MALKKTDEKTPPDSNPHNGKRSTTSDQTLAEFQASATALALIEAFARVAAYHAVADAKRAARGGDEWD